MGRGGEGRGKRTTKLVAKVSRRVRMVRPASLDSAPSTLVYRSTSSVEVGGRGGDMDDPAVDTPDRTNRDRRMDYKQEELKNGSQARGIEGWITSKRN